MVAGISIQLGQRISRVGGLAAVLDDTVIVDDVVESGSEFDTHFADGCGVVALGWTSLGRINERNQTST